MLLAVTLFSVMSAFVKAAAVPPGEAVFFRAFFSLPVILGWLALRGELSEGLRTARPMAHAWRGLVGTAAMGLGFAGLGLLPLPEVTALQFATPILIVLFAAVLLGERIRVIRVTAVFVGLAGVLVILWPRLSVSGSASELLGAVVVLGSATFAAFAQIFVKRMAGREHTAAIVFYFAVTATVLSFLTIPFGWVWPTPQSAVFLVGAGMIGGVGQILLTSSYRHAEAGVLAPFTYVSMLWALLIGWLVFAEAPTLPMLLGSALVIASGVVIVLRERQLGKAMAAEAKVRAKGWQ